MPGKPAPEVSPAKRARESEDNVHAPEEARKKRKQDIAPERNSRDAEVSRPKDPTPQAAETQEIERAGEDLKIPSRRQKKRRQKKREDSRTQRVSEDEEAPRVTDDTGQLVKKSRLEDIKSKHPHSEKALALANGALDEDSTAWSLSDSIAGQFLYKDPVFAGDEKYLILAVENSIHIYSAETSLLVRSLPVAYGEVITDYVLSPTKPDHLYVSTISGVLYEWNWRTADVDRSWKVGRSVVGLSATCGATHDILFVNREKNSGKCIITAQEIGEKSTKNSSSLQILRRKDLSRTLRTLQGGRIVLAFAMDRVLIGFCKEWTGTVHKDCVYVWHEVTLPDIITTIDVRVRPGPQEALNKPTKTPAAIPAMDVVVGCAKGSILLYEDLFARLIQKEKHSANDSGLDITSRRLHWHRAAPSVVRWSRDGNYIISGGSETVLVLWQLDTNEQNFLPHLSAPICDLVVSPRGSSYAVRLGDNSIMILSTSDLKPTASISGLVIHGPLAPACTNPRYPDQIILAVPASCDTSSSHQYQPNATILQTFDARLSSQISRQALTRNNITNINVGPDGQRLREPNVKFLKISHDGHWLATVDEWLQSEQDVTALFSDKEELQSQLHQRKEMFLKFWSWDDQNKAWELVTRIDRPHLDASGAGDVLDLIANDSRIEFATVGNDGFVRTWIPKPRYRNGLVVRSQVGQPLYTWGCRHAIQLENRSAWDHHSSMSAHLACSNDGSLLVSSWCVEDSYQSGSLYFIDNTRGDICQTRAQEHSGPFLQLGFLGRYFISLSDQLHVWDTVEQIEVFSLPLDLEGKAPTEPIVSTRLAVNVVDQTFAIAFSKGEGQNPQSDEHSRSEIMVFDGANAKPVYRNKVDAAVSALLPAARARGYLVIDSGAKVRRLGPNGALSEVEHVEEDLNIPSGLENMFGRSLRGPAAPPESGSQGRGDATDLPVRHRQLADIFDIPSFSAPPVSDLFDQVAGLFSQKSLTAR